MFRSLVVLALAVGVARADVESGPKAGEKAGPVKAFGVVGTVEGKEADFVAERKGAPTVYLFVNASKFDRPMNQFIKTLDGKITDIDAKAMAVAVWLTDDADKSKEFVARIQKSVKYQNTSLAVLGETAGPNGWGINPDAHLTAVVVVGGKVVKSFPYESVNGTDSKAVLESLKKAVEKK